MSNKKRYLVIGDVHGRTIWKDILKKENPDKVIFLGDYVTSHNGISSEEQISNFEEILKYKEDHSDNVILLRGNHCMQHLGYDWAECSGFDKKVFEYMSNPNVKNLFLSNTQWIYVDDGLKTIFSHAGISEVWMEKIARITSVNDINDMQPSEVFGFVPDNMYDYYGTSKTQPPTWIRPQSLCTCNILGYDQVVGHTPVQRNIINIGESCRGRHNIWLCDALDLRQYLTIIDEEFIVNTYEN